MRPRDFDRLYAENAGPLLAFLTFRTGDADLADDLTADTFERALRGRRRFDPRRASERTWLFSIALNLLRDHGRRTEAGRRATARSEADRPALDDGGLQHVEQRDRVARAMRASARKIVSWSRCATAPISRSRRSRASRISPPERRQLVSIGHSRRWQRPSGSRRPAPHRLRF